MDKFNGIFTIQEEIKNSVTEMITELKKTIEQAYKDHTEL